ncbi:MAG TPA: hypothetical protein VJ550_03555 [Geomonas sp.]|nr:hypothetical protein [Geomonas sp.]
MGALVDILLLDRADANALRTEYPEAVLENRTNTGHRIQEYHLVLTEGEQVEDRYFDFLLDRLIATASRNFQARYSNDQEFRARMKARADENLRKLKAKAEERERAEVAR